MTRAARIFRDFMSCELRFEEPMREHTTFGLGGPAEVMVLARDTEDIRLALRLAREHDIPAMVMGSGSNLLVREGGLDGVVIKLGEGFSGIREEGGLLVAQAGVYMPDLSEYALEAGLCGLEFACGIPGSLGGGLYMNAGAYGGQFSDIVESVQVLMTDLEIVEVPGADMDFGYRHSVLHENGGVALSARLRLLPGIREEISALMQENTRLREAKQPLDLPSAGSVFKRPPGHFAGKLIDEAGMRGARLGGAQVSPKHSGFIVNTGDATTQEVIDLIELVRTRVHATSGVLLETELKIIGNRGGRA